MFIYPRPDCSGRYLPIPRSGGKDKQNERDHIHITILTALEYDSTFPVIRPT